MSASRFPPYIELGPERSFRLEPVTGNGSSAVGSMETGDWSRDASGRAQAGALGVLIDDVLGFSAAALTPDGFSTVTTHIHADFLCDVPADESTVTADVTSVDVDATGGLASGTVRSAAGRTIARATLRSRFVPGAPDVEFSNPSSSSDPVSADVLATLGGVIEYFDGGLDLRFPVRPDAVNVKSNLHGGLTFCAAELSGAAALRGHSAHTTAVDIVYLRAAPLGSELVFRATVVHPGRQLGLARVEAMNERGKPIAVAMITRNARC